MKPFIALSVTTVLVALTEPAQAGGFDYPAPGSAGLARGGAFAARADDPTAIYYNPAGLGRLKGTHVLINGNILNENIRFVRGVYPGTGASPSQQAPADRYPHDSTLSMPEVRNDDPPFITPFVAISSDLGGVLTPANLVLLAGFYGPHVHPSHTFPRYCEPGSRVCVPSATETELPSPARYDLVAMDVLVLYPTLGLAWQPIEGLSLGAHFQATYASFDFQLATASLDASENPEMDVDIFLSTRDWFTPTGIFGLHWQALPWLELGASVRMGFTLDFEGEVESEMPENLSSISMDPNPAEITLAIPMPWVVRSGARYVNRDSQDRERFDLELDFVWESNADLETYEAKTEASVKVGTLTFPVDSLDQDHFWKNTWSLRLGGTYQLHDLFQHGTLILRLGGFYESPAAPMEYTRLDYLPFTRVGLSAGLGVRWERYSFSVGYSHIFHDRRTVVPDGLDASTGLCAETNGEEGCGSKVRLVVPVDPAQGSAVGNGVYDVSIDIVTLGATVSFGS